ncbi:MAG: DUF4381 domain-containing protein [Panacagrimonas sp.]
MNTDWLSQLAPAHAPPPAGWWPPAPGWWVLALLLLVALAAFVYWLRNPARRLRSVALRELRALESNDDDTRFARGLESLLRRYAVAKFGREKVARLSGKAWLEFVVAHGGAAWAGATGQDVLRLVYGGQQGGFDRSRALSGARGFLKDSKPVAGIARSYKIRSYVEAGHARDRVA